MTICKKLLLLVPLVASLMVLTAPSASAADVTFNLTSDHCTNGCGPAGTIFGTVSLTQNGTTVDVVVHLNSGFAFAKTGAADMQAFKFNAGAPVTLANITVDPHVPPLVAAAGAFSGDGTGNFGFGINCPSCGGGLSDAFTTDIVFHVSNTTIAN